MRDMFAAARPSGPFATRRNPEQIKEMAGAMRIIQASESASSAGRRLRSGRGPVVAEVLLRGTQD
jgi:hypothetical protein